MLAVTGWLADGGTVTPGITVIAVALFDLVGSLTEVALTVTDRLAAREPLGGV
jgi:hypothetical protein